MLFSILGKKTETCINTITLKYSVSTKMNILKSAETPLYMGVSVDFSIVEAATFAHLPQNRADFEYFSTD